MNDEPTIRTLGRRYHTLRAQVEQNSQDTREIRELKIVIKWLWRGVGVLATVLGLVAAISAFFG